MNKRYKIYFLLIIILIGVIIFANYFMTPEYVFGDEKMSPKGLPTISNKKDKSENAKVYKSKDIPEMVLKGSDKYDFYKYLFIYPDNKIVFYAYREGSVNPADSEKFHEQVTDYVYHKVHMGNYKIFRTTVDYAKVYDETLFENCEEAFYEPQPTDSKSHQEKMLKKRAYIDAVREFYKECEKGMCIIDIDKKKYVSLENRDIDAAKKLLEDYMDW